MNWKVLSHADTSASKRVQISVRKHNKSACSFYVLIGNKLPSRDHFMRHHVSAMVGEGEHTGMLRISLDGEGEFLGVPSNNRKTASCSIRLPIFEPFEKPMPLTIVPHTVAEDGREIFIDLKPLIKSFTNSSPEPQTPSPEAPKSTSQPPPPPSPMLPDVQSETLDPIPAAAPTPSPKSPPTPPPSPTLTIDSTETTAIILADEKPILKLDPSPSPTPSPTPAPPPTYTPSPSPSVDAVPPSWRGKPSQPPLNHPTRIFRDGDTLTLIGGYLFWNLKDRVAINRDCAPLIRALLDGPLSRDEARKLTSKDIDVLIGNIRTAVRSLPNVSIKTLDGSKGWDLVG